MENIKIKNLIKEIKVGTANHKIAVCYAFDNREQLFLFQQSLKNIASRNRFLKIYLLVPAKLIKKTRKIILKEKVINYVFLNFEEIGEKLFGENNAHPMGVKTAFPWLVEENFSLLIDCDTIPQVDLDTLLKIDGLIHNSIIRRSSPVQKNSFVYEYEQKHNQNFKEIHGNGGVVLVNNNMYKSDFETFENYIKVFNEFVIESIEISSEFIATNNNTKKEKVYTCDETFYDTFCTCWSGLNEKFNVSFYSSPLKINSLIDMSEGGEFILHLLWPKSSSYKKCDLISSKKKEKILMNIYQNVSTDKKWLNSSENLREINILSFNLEKLFRK